MRRVVFLEDALEELNTYKFGQPKLVFKILELIAEIDRTPFVGMGKPEPLKENLRGWWSRRVSDEHRLIYKVTDEEITILSCKSHYS